jgi:tetratricopeptide (TPR) repeat protein
MNRYTIIGLAVGFVLGLFVGTQVRPGGGGGAPSAAAPMPQMPPMPAGAAGPDVELQGRIAMNQSIVARDPKNVQAWIQLGNDFFDAHQAQKAIEAYGRALELRPDDANVLTDQGIMYRALGQFDKAIANFEKANRADPKHVQSLYNIGVVYSADLKKPKEAIAAWNRVIQIAPQSEQAASARAGIEGLKASAGN